MTEDNVLDIKQGRHPLLHPSPNPSPSPSLIPSLNPISSPNPSQAATRCCTYLSRSKCPTTARSAAR